MINARHRFHGHNSVNRVYKQGRTIRGNLCSIKYIESGRDTYRAAVVVSKKVSKSAVVRNRIRRRVYEILRATQPNFREPYDIIFTIFSEQVAEVPQEVLRKTIEGQLREAKIVRGNSATVIST